MKNTNDNSESIWFHCCKVATAIIWKQKEGKAEYEAVHNGVKIFSEGKFTFFIDLHFHEIPI